MGATIGGSPDMDRESARRFPNQWQTGLKGEAFFESLISDHSIPHRVVGLKDIGIDYFCEWVHDDKTTGILYAVQIKTRTSLNVEKVGRNAENGLREFRITGLGKIDAATRDYWRGFGVPVYLFVVTVLSKRLDCYYKRFTPILTDQTCERKYEDDNDSHTQGFYRVKKDDSFIAFSNNATKSGGFARDLYVDYVRCSYSRGLISFQDPRELGLYQFRGRPRVFKDLFRQYEDQIREVHAKTRRFLRHLDTSRDPSGEERPSDTDRYESIVGTTSDGLFERNPRFEEDNPGEDPLLEQPDNRTDHCTRSKWFADHVIESSDDEGD
jgi:hypothetical protein